MATKFLDYTGLNYLWNKIKTYAGNFACTAAKALGIHFIIPNETEQTATLTATITGITSYFVGLTIALRMPFNTPASATLNINNLGAKPIYYKVNTTSANYYPANTVVLLVYETTTLNTGCFKMVYAYDSNTNNATAQNISTSSNTFPVLIGYTANATANIGNKATYFCKDVKIQPSTGILSANGFVGDVTGDVTGNASTASAIAWSGVTDKPSTFTPSSHNQASDTINAMTGYSKPNSGSAIAISDSLNSAIGKLEAKVDSVDDSNYVHLTGDEDIDGAKSFRSVYLKSEDITKGTNPSAKIYRGLAFVDNNFDPTNAYYMHRLGILEYALNTDGVSNIAISAYKNTANSTNVAGIYVYYDTANDLAYAMAPSTLASRSEGTDIVTRDWIGQDDRIVRTSGVQTVGGQKTFASDVILGNHDVRAPSNDTYCCFAGGAGESYDKGGALFVYGKDFVNADNSDAQSGAFLLRSVTGSTHYDLFGNKSGLLTWRGNNVHAGISTSGSGNAVTAISVSNNTLSVTKGTTFVATSGDQTIGGEKKFINHINMLSETSNANSRYIYIQNGTLTAGGAIDSNWWTGLQVIDKNGDFLAGSRFIYFTSKEVRVQLDVYQVTTGGVAFAATSATSSIGTFFPTVSSATLLGMSNKKWKEIWCTQSSINSSSDERLKDYISSIPENILDAWEDINFIQFKFKDAIQEKGESARLHNGLIAQDIDKVFKKYDIDISKYGLFLYDEWEAENEEYDDNGKLINKAVPAGNAYGLRYTEALCMEAAYQRRKNKILENRISELERQVSDMLILLQNLTNGNG